MELVLRFGARLDLAFGGPGERHLDHVGPEQGGSTRRGNPDSRQPDRTVAVVKVFISSVISGLEEHRTAAREGREPRHAVIASEDFGASQGSPQQVCLAGVREADVVILLLGMRYGTPQASSLSLDHEEYRAVRGTKPVLVFVQAGVTPEPDQQRHSSRRSTAGRAAPTRNRSSARPPRSVTAVTRALHDWELSQQAGPVDDKELLARAARRRRRSESSHSPGAPLLHVVVAGAPAQQLLRPAKPG